MVEQFLIDMGLRIMELRRQHDWTQNVLAERVGVSGQTISTAELGKKALRPENIVKISIALGVSTDYLLTGRRTSFDYTVIASKLENVSPVKYERIMRMIDLMLEE